MKKGKYIRLAAILGALAVAIGAFGAHGLSSILESTGKQATFETAVNYHFYHVFAIFGTAILFEIFPEKTLLKKSIWLFFVGIIIFSGSLYILALTGINILGAITPLGGVAFILGWTLLFWSFKNPKK
ncbi:hypothetical protein P872_18185 [Rhodonellum psychrophilum GCM71 = DSM 17998]|uniref:DUF423 domain-containing protein n=2 Tax=Rhodonellum TaxID=336827 RepID=U5C2P5_9BACT|nr:MULTISPECIES: DUF423 domain-containing protein [Rhodonellum]ERM82442.1 hypothetical protein P872_18185 [Rhodonellum psychrophilum GCM71 = DSM 17998]SDY87798.1 Uncharacterized membrane protein YgdD, TMEM256/DUF423 family [Rhodonellum ikkaensis]